MTQSIVIAVSVVLVGCGGDRKAPADAAPPVPVADAAPPDAALGRITVGEIPEELRGALERLPELPIGDRAVAAEPVDGSLTSTQIDRVIKARAGVLRACYQKQLAKRPDLAGKVTVAFTIAKDGAVATAAIDREASTLHDDHVEACVLRQFGKLRFPASSAEAKVRYPLLYAPP